MQNNNNHGTPLAAGQDAGPNLRLQPMRLPEFMSQQYPEPVFVLDGIIPPGVGLLVGAPKAKKTWLALDIGLSVAGGWSVLGRPVAQGPVLYGALEGLPKNHQQRIELVLAGQAQPEDFWVIDQLPALGAGLEDAVVEWVEHHGARLVIIDTLIRVKGDKVSSARHYEQDAALLRRFEELLRGMSSPCAVLFVHHSRETQAADPLDTANFTRGITGTVESALVLQANPQLRSDGTLHVIGRQIEDASLALRWDNDACRWIAQGAAVEFLGGELRGRVIALLRTSGRALSPAEIAVALGIEPSTCRAALTRMVKRGQLVRVGHGIYQLPDPS